MFSGLEAPVQRRQDSDVLWESRATHLTPRALQSRLARRRQTQQQRGAEFTSKSRKAEEKEADVEPWDAFVQHGCGRQESTGRRNDLSRQRWE